jgi:parallel beta-helix repeat protein
MLVLGKLGKRLLSGCLIVGMVFAQIGTLPLKVSAADTNDGHTYYVSNDGNDGLAGTSPETAWKSLDKVNAQTFSPGDQILFKRGDKWENKTLYPKGSGSDGNPIKIASYGDSQKALPAIAANAQVNDAVYLYNQQYWEISELDVSNTSAGYSGVRNATNGALLKDLRGIHITGRDVATLSGINLHNLYVHDVTGYDAWIGGLEDTNTTNWSEPGIIMNTGWDFSKRTGGILIEALKPTGNTPTIFKNITLADSTLEHNSFGAFTIKQWSGGSSGPKWAKRSTSATAPAYSDSNFKPHENITVKGNYIDQSGDYNANGIYVTSSKNVLVENNVVKNPGVCGIELYFVDNAVVQHNEVYGSRPKAGGADSNGIDPDREVTNTIIQYNYVHDNGDGILVCGFDYNSVIIRYNLLKDNTGIWFRDSVGKGLIEIYNNICYNTLDRGSISFANSHGGGGSSDVWKYRNNIFYNISDKVNSVSFGNDSSTNNIFDNNLYYGPGVSAPSRDQNAIAADPMFTESEPIYGSGDSVANRVKDFSALKPKAGSPLINAGKPYVKNASAILINTNELDYEGKGLSATPEIGLFEAQFNGTLSGYVTNEYGEKVANAQVKLGDKETVNTNTNGYYVIPDINMGTYSVTISKDGYQSKTQSVDVTSETDGLNLSIGEFINKNREVNGIVTDSNGTTVEGAKVTISANGSPVATAISGIDGSYSLKNVPIGAGYTITVSKDGYYDGLELSVSIFAEQSNGINVRLKAGVSKRSLISDDFNQYEAGKFTGSNLWGVYNNNTSNVVEIVTDPDDSNNKLLHLKRSGGALSVYNKWEANISGVFTINTRVKRTTTQNQYGIYTFHKSGFNTTTPTSSTNPEATLAMVGGKIISHNIRGSSATVTAAEYTANVWYDVTQVVDWGTGTYDLYVDGKLKLRNQPLRTWAADLDYLQIFSTDGTGDFYVDYIDVYQGFPYNDKLSSIMVSDTDLTVAEGNDTLYTGTVAGTVGSVTVTANRSTDFPSRIFVNGVQATTGEPSKAITLQTGENTVSIDLKDYENNVLRSYTLKLLADLTAPVTTCDAPEGWTKDDVIVNLLADDSQSGVAKTYYSIDGSDYTEGYSFIVQSEGIHTISFYSVDNSGNVEEVNTKYVRIDKTTPVTSIDLNNEYKLGTILQLNSLTSDNLSGIVNEKVLIFQPNDSAGTEVYNGSSIQLDRPGDYKVSITATDAAGNSYSIEKSLVVYIPADIKVTPNAINDNNGILTVRVELPAGYNTQDLNLNTAALDGVYAFSNNNGYYNQAKLGQFKFQRSDVDWTYPQMMIEFRCYINDYLVVGQRNVNVQ